MKKQRQNNRNLDKKFIFSPFKKFGGLLEEFFVELPDNFVFLLDVIIKVNNRSTKEFPEMDIYISVTKLYCLPDISD